MPIHYKEVFCDTCSRTFVVTDELDEMCPVCAEIKDHGMRVLRLTVFMYAVLFVALVGCLGFLLGK